MSEPVTHDMLSAAIDVLSKKALAVAGERDRLRAWLERVDEFCKSKADLFNPEIETLAVACDRALRGYEAPKGPGL